MSNQASDFFAGAYFAVAAFFAALAVAYLAFGVSPPEALEWFRAAVCGRCGRYGG